MGKKQAWHSRGSQVREWLFVSSAFGMTVALAGCGAGQTTEKPVTAHVASLDPNPSTSPQLAHVPSPKPTTASPGRTSAGQGPANSLPPVTTGNACVTSALKGSCGPYTYPQMEGTSQDPTVGQNVWSPIHGWQQTLHANNPGNWYATVNGPAGNTAVVSYPNTGASYGEKPLSGFHSITSSFTESMPHNSGTSGWAAYDLWFNNWNDEVMIQHDFTNNGPCDAVATHTFGGSNGVPAQSWHLCVFGSERVWKLGTNDSHLLSERSGSVDILSMLTWMENNGYLPRNSTVTDLSYGFEVCSTGGKSEAFTVSRFSISAT